MHVHVCVLTCSLLSVGYDTVGMNADFNLSIKSTILKMEHDKNNIKSIMIHHFGARSLCLRIFLILIRLKLDTMWSKN